MRLSNALMGGAAALLIAVAACDGDLPTGPGGAYDIQLNLLGGGFTYDRPPFSSDVLCYGEIEARVAGVARVQWSKTVIRVFTGADRSAPTRVDTFPAEVFAPFRRARVTMAQPDTAAIGAQMALPGEREYEFFYRLNGAGREYAAAPVRVRCGPDIGISGPAPAVQLTGIPGADSIYDIGDTITINYRVDAAATLLRTEIRLTGPFSVTRGFVEAFPTAQTYSERFVVPRYLQSGLPLRVEIAATDGLGRTVTLDSLTRVVPVDSSAPRIIASTLSRQQVAVGSTLRASVTVRENNSTDWIIWEFDGEFSQRDSAFVNNLNGEFTYEVAVLVPPAWAEKGARLRVWARDRAGNLSAPATSDPFAYSFYVSSPMSVLFTGTYAYPTIESDPQALVYDAKRSRVYVSFTQGGKVAVLDATTGTQVAYLDVPPLPGGMDLSLSGDSLLITQSTQRAIAVLDLNTLTLLPPITSAVLDSVAAAEPANPPVPTGIRVAANGKLLVLLHRVTAGGHRVVELNPAAGTGRVRTEATGMTGFARSWWARAASTLDRTRIVMFDAACPRAYLSVSDSFSACGTVIASEVESPLFGAASVSADALSGRSHFADRAYDASLTPIASLSSLNAQLMPGGEYAVVQRGDALDKVRISDGRTMRRLYPESSLLLGRLLSIPGTQDYLMFPGPGFIMRVRLSEFY
jgi:hypothetical protein